MKNVLITGATGQLGRTVVEKFAARGYQVLALVSPGKKAPAPAISYEADLTNEAQTKAAFAAMMAQHTSIDACLLLAGGYAGGSLADTDKALLDEMIGLNFFTTYFVAQAAVQQMRTQPTGGRLVMIAARPALQAKEGKSKVAYTLSKSLVVKLAELLNAEASAQNVFTAVIVPSTIDTASNRKDMPDADFSKWVPAADLADAMLYLCSEEARNLREPVLKMYGKA